jgi:hypothetical protein
MLKKSINFFISLLLFLFIFHEKQDISMVFLIFCSTFKIKYYECLLKVFLDLRSKNPNKFTFEVKRVKTFDEPKLFNFFENSFLKIRLKIKICLFEELKFKGYRKLNNYEGNEASFGLINNRNLI